jgi:hypothetical protein
MLKDISLNEQQVLFLKEVLERLDHEIALDRTSEVIKNQILIKLEE